MPTFLGPFPGSSFPTRKVHLFFVWLENSINPTRVTLQIITVENSELFLKPIPGEFFPTLLIL
jgi:hypothetical protein